MKKILASIFLWFFGWRINIEVTEAMKRSVMVAAPHTTNWDFPIAIAAFWKSEVPIRFFIKDSYTKGITGSIMRWLGAIGVDRTKSNNLTAYAIELLNDKENPKVILVPAEGTRKKVERWKTGFYHIAQEAKVPITMGFLDYKKKIGGTLGVFYPSGDFEKDMTFLQEKYKDIKGKYPENYNPKIF